MPEQETGWFDNRLPPRLERDLQRAIAEFLVLHGWLTFSFAASGTHGRLHGAVPTGWPDLLAIKKSEYLHIEVKMLGRDLTPSQEDMRVRLRKHGAKVFVTHSVEETRNILRELGHEVRF